MKKKSKTYIEPRIPVKLTEDQFNEFILRHLPIRKRGPRYKISDFKIFNYILYFLHTGCQWKMLPIDRDANGNPEIHYTLLFRIFQKWNAHGAFLHMFENSVLALYENGHLDTRVIHGDGTTTLAKKGGDCIGLSGHKHMKGEKIVAFCDRH